MHEHLLHQPVEKVLFLWVGPFRHNLLEVDQQGCKHLLVDSRQLQTLPPSLQLSLLGLQFLQPCAQIPDFLIADLGLQCPRLERLEVAV